MTQSSSFGLQIAEIWRELAEHLNKITEAESNPNSHENGEDDDDCDS